MRERSGFPIHLSQSATRHHDLSFMQPCLRIRQHVLCANVAPDTQCDRIPHVARWRSNLFEIVQANAQLTRNHTKGDSMVRAKLVAVTCAAALAAFSVAGLSGCSAGQHEIIDQGKSCTSCHSDQKQTYDAAAPSSAAQSNGEVTVKTSASQVLVCKPHFISEDGSKFVPEQVSAQAVTDGKAAIKLEEGTWAVCTNEGSVKAKLVTVTGSASGAADVEL